MKKILSMLAVFVCLLAVSVPTNVNAQTVDNVPVLSVSGEGTATAVPDRAVINIGVQSFKTDAALAQQDNARKSNQVQQAILALGIEAKDIQTQNYSFNPSYVRDEVTKENRIEGYNVNNTVVVVVNDVSKVGKVVDTALANGANKISSLRFSVKNSEPLRKQALQNAIKDAKSKADIIADGLGMKVVGIRSVNESVGMISTRDFSNAKMLMAVGSDASTPVAAGTLELDANINIEYILG